MSRVVVRCRGLAHTRQRVGGGDEYLMARVALDIEVDGKLHAASRQSFIRRPGAAYDPETLEVIPRQATADH